MIDTIAHPRSRTVMVFPVVLWCCCPLLIDLPIAYTDLAMVGADGHRPIEPGAFDLWVSVGDGAELHAHIEAA